ncbi:MAG: uridine kinase [Bacteroidales bacterium]|jgi:uridine kinase|nr:uridine kinase [Bacteroidales bacterium]
MLVIGIAGGSGSGKTTVVNKIIRGLPSSSVSIISQDAYYWDNGHLDPQEKKMINFDHPDSIEWELLVHDLDRLISGYPIEMPVYSYVSCARSKETITIMPSRVIIVEGILILTNEQLRNRFNVKVFVDADADDRLIRIIQRDILERGRSVDTVLTHYETFVKPMHLQFIEPSKRYADLIIPQGGENEVAIDLLSSRINWKLNQEK